MWYWVCRGKGNTDVVFRTIYCVKSNIKAKLLLQKEKLFGELSDYSKETGEKDKWFIREDIEHSDPKYPQYPCSDCGYVMNKEEIESLWDPGGPVCVNCGSQSMDLLVDVMESVLSDGKPRLDIN